MTGRGVLNQLAARIAAGDIPPAFAPRTALFAPQQSELFNPGDPIPDPAAACQLADQVADALLAKVAILQKAAGGAH